MLQAKKTTLVEPISRDTHDKSYADIPDGKRARDHGYEPLALVAAYIAGAESKLCAGKKQDHPKNGGKRRSRVPTDPLKKRATKSITIPRMTSAPPVRAPKRT